MKKSINTKQQNYRNSQRGRQRNFTEVQVKKVMQLYKFNIPLKEISITTNLPMSSVNCIIYSKTYK